MPPCLPSISVTLVLNDAPHPALKGSVSFPLRLHRVQSLHILAFSYLMLFSTLRPKHGFGALSLQQTSLRGEMYVSFLSKAAAAAHLGILSWSPSLSLKGACTMLPSCFELFGVPGIHPVLFFQRSFQVWTPILLAVHPLCMWWH